MHRSGAVIRLLRRFSWLPAAACIGLFGCAQIGAPGGGPEDREAPKVAATWPDSGAVGVAGIDSLALVFSEPMNRRSVEENFFVSPPIEFSERSWNKAAWILRLRRPLEPGRTYVGLLGTGAKDRHGNGPKKAWAFAFSAGDSLDTGRVAGKVVAQRYKSKSVFIYVWPWSTAPPDTTREGFPADPLRLGQADAQGAYELDYLPRRVPLRVCALYDREGDLRFDPGSDRWGCLEEPLVIADTSKVVTGVDLYVADPDEPGTVAGTVVDSTCTRSRAARTLDQVRVERDSLHTVLEEGEVPGEQPPTAQDSVRIGARMLSLDSLATAARAESLFCVKPFVVQLTSDTTVVRESITRDKYSWADVPPGTYHLRAFRDLNGNSIPEGSEPQVRYPYAIEVRPLRVLDKIDLALPQGGPR